MSGYKTKIQQLTGHVRLFDGIDTGIKCPAAADTVPPLGGCHMRQKEAYLDQTAKPQTIGQKRKQQRPEN